MPLSGRAHGGDRHVAAPVVHDPTQAAALELEALGGLGREEDPLARVALGHRGRLALGQLLHRIELAGQAQGPPHVLERADAAVHDLDRDLRARFDDDHLDLGGPE
ncbi:MAG: hypothetical protein M5U09_17620 [Gammaproteobacteria bacterium]|nr:hypothetical protein [Gammaproteobacteria bacterium]